MKREYWKYFPLVLGYVAQHKRLGATSLTVLAGVAE
jgi:hypothetical protein